MDNGLLTRDDLILIGRIGRAHGVRGEVKVYPETDTPERFLDLEALNVGASAEAVRPLPIEGARFQYPKGGGLVVLLKLEGIDDRDEAKTLNGLKLFASEDDLPPLEEGEIYLHDLIGFEVFERQKDSGDLLYRGIVSNVLEGGQRLLVVQGEETPDVLVPDVDPIVEEVDVEARRVIVKPPEGLF